MIDGNNELQADQSVDARGLSCPLPLLRAKLALNGMASGQVLYLCATDAGSQRDIARFSELAGHSLLRADEQDGEFHYWLRKAGAREEG
ncbi:sulfurtransferase TusA family protein [Pseudomonas sp. FME51]|uniref:sulfurtransferase TusA family protein n=1 Tax=Pseudomonas sp. FME51 TaxID=2742609 RepID=UPI001868B43D|nr:sulfurtransferase TusA family protein [Pseudomonas sp. FME51]